MKNNTSFLRFYTKKGILINYSMTELEELIKEKKKKEIAELIYKRFYYRFIKVFEYSDNKKKIYQKDKKKVKKKVFETEFKSGFLILVSSCVMIETISSFIQGIDKTENISGRQSFDVFFKKCFSYNNDLKIFQQDKFYTNIRNALLHQGETYSNFKITREGKLYEKEERKINATLFLINLKEFLIEYKKELIEKNWEDEIWSNCKNKLECIIKKSE